MLRYRDKQIKSVSEMIKKLKADSGFYDGPIWYRGQSKSDYKLTPSLYRKPTEISERTLIKKFKQNATLLIDRPNDNEFEWLFVMQHHGVPTRLLDWTESSLVALYFACFENMVDDGVLWILLPTELNKHSGLGSDEVFDIPGINDLGNYHPDSYHADRTNIMGPAAAITSRNTIRMQAQQGTFTIFHKKKEAIEEIGDKKQVWRYVIPANNKLDILEELRICGINKFQLFPELSSIGDLLKSEI